jgi:hypothetical protein
MHYKKNIIILFKKIKIKKNLIKYYPKYILNELILLNFNLN